EFLATPAESYWALLRLHSRLPASTPICLAVRKKVFPMGRDMAGIRDEASQFACCSLAEAVACSVRRRSFNAISPSRAKIRVMLLPSQQNPARLWRWRLHS